MRRKTTHNSGLAKVAVSFAADTFVVNQTFLVAEFPEEDSANKIT
jgi:hypothetical protein